MGYFGGDPDRVRVERVDTVMNILAYSKFLDEVEEVARELNKKDT